MKVQLLLQKQWQEQADDMEEDSLGEDEKQLLSKIRSRRQQAIRDHRQKKVLHGGNSVMPRSKSHAATLSDMKKGLEMMGMDASQAVSRARSASVVRMGRKRSRSIASAGLSCSDAPHGEAEMAPAKRVHSSKSRSLSRGVRLCQSNVQIWYLRTWTPAMV
jgi:hypothetical protein